MVRPDEVHPSEVRHAEVRHAEVRHAEVGLSKIKVEIWIFFSPLIPRLDSFLQLRNVLRIRHTSIAPGRSAVEAPIIFQKGS